MAGIGQYDQPGKHEFINSYVPIPFQEMAGALQARQRSYADTAAARDTTFNALKDVPAHRFDEPAYQEIIGSLDQELNEFNKKHPDLSSLEAKTGLNKILQSTTRKKFFRDISANLPVLQQMEKDLAIAEAEGRPWDAMDIMESLQQYQQVGGAVGAGQIAPRGLAEATDIIPTLETMGRSFIREGQTITFNEEDGKYRTSEGVVGVSPDEVASVYGLFIGDGTLKLDYIPEKVYSNPKFATMRNRAEYASSLNPDLSYEEAVGQAYYQAVAPLVDKYSGYQLDKSKILTSKGLSDLQSNEFTIQYFGDATAAASRREKISKDFGTKIKNFFIGGLGNLTEKKEQELYSKLTDDDKDILNSIVESKPAEFSQPSFDLLSNKEKKVAITEANKRIKTWNERAITTPIAALDTKIKGKMATIIFGFNSDNGIVRGENIGGFALDLKIFNPRDPGSEKTAKELRKHIKKNSTIEYIGPVSADNDFGPGLHAIKIDDEEFYIPIQSFGNQLDSDNILYGTDVATQIVPWKLYDYKRHMDGKGDWFPVEDGLLWIRSVTDNWDEEGKPDQVQLEIVDKATYDKAMSDGIVDDKGRGNIPGVQPMIDPGPDPVVLFNLLNHEEIKRSRGI